jgi:hypothetical protein
MFILENAVFICFMYIIFSPSLALYMNKLAKKLLVASLQVHFHNTNSHFFPRSSAGAYLCVVLNRNDKALEIREKLLRNNKSS